jgi:hypothetical protein
MLVTDATCEIRVILALAVGESNVEGLLSFLLILFQIFFVHES